MMGKNNGNSWLNAVKKAFRSPTNDDEKKRSKRREENEQQEEENKRGKKRWIFRKHIPQETTIQHKVVAKSTISPAVTNTSGQENLVAKQPKAGNIISVSEQKRAIAVAMETAEAAIATAQAAVEIIRLTKPSLSVKQHNAAVFIQTIFRGYLARRALLALKGVVKMQALIRGHNVRKRAKMTLQCIQSLVRVQALVCDQRRRLSCDATMFSQANSSRKSTSRNANYTSNNLELEEIQALIQKAKECSLKQGKTLAHILSNQTWTLDEDHNSDNNYEEPGEEEQKLPGKKTIHPTVGKDRNLCNRKDPIKTVEIDTSITSPNYSFKSRDQYHDSYFNSPKTPSSSNIKSIQVHSYSLYHQTEDKNYRTAETPTSRAIYLHRMSMSENSCPLPRPNYMANTASAMARVRSHSTPRHRPNSPSRQQQTSSVKKRLSFPNIIPDGHNADDNVNFRRYKGSQFGDEQRSNVPCYFTE
ncbi:hypothetical protein DH2020_045720 [Rehmannia glutinosa]|uniref:DUF4005 domain-containing protein n=1 Tax=Rehmannia glutinosa TaxID=99300 RepID=A0ABR0UE97_REHGL